MVFISNHYSNCKGLKITNESDPIAFKIREKSSGFKARKATESGKYVT
jgi:hypothetical protein